MSIQIDNFEDWNEKEMAKNSPELYYSHANFIIRFIEKSRINQVLKMLDAQIDDKILEVGCGQGHILTLIRRGELFGLDLSDKMLADAQKRLGERVKLFKANAENFVADFGDLKFDKIIASEVLEHTQNPEKVLSQIRLALKDNGWLIVSIPNEKLINWLKRVLIKTGFFNLFFSGVSKDATEEFHLHAFDLNLLKEKVGERFKWERVAGVPFGFLPIRFVVKFIKK